MATDRCVLFFFIVASVLLLSNLKNGYLWQDEAETALLARHTLEFGYPKVSDGHNYIEEAVHGHGPGEAWIYSPWLPFYLLAGVFAVAGESTWTARFPFALLGLLSVFLTWRLCVFVTKDLRVQRLSVALLTCSVPFLLHMRQSRYYAPVTCLLVGLCLAYLKFCQKASLKRAWVLGITLVLLFHANFGTYVPAMVLIVLHQALRGRREARRRFAIMCGAVIGLTLPWALLFYQGAFIGTVSLSRLADHLEYYVRVTNKYLFPLAFILAASGLYWLVRAGRPPRSSLGRRTWTISPATQFLLLMVAAQFAFLLIPDQRHMRYIIPVVPLLVIGQAWWLAACLTRHRLAGSVVAGLMLFTNVLQSVHVRVPLAAFAWELTHRYTGPMEGIVAYLRAHGHPEDLVKIPYDDRTLMFYTTLRVERPSRFPQESYPEWIVLRRDWLPGGFLKSDYFSRIQARYERIELDAPDILWQNREDPGSHHFATVQEAPPVVIYRRRDLQHG